MFVLFRFTKTILNTLCQQISVTGFNLNKLFTNIADVPDFLN